MLCSYNEVFVWFTGDFWFLDKRLLLCWDLICIRITYSPLHLDIHVCTSIVLHIDVYKEIFCIFHFTLIFNEMYTYSASNKPGLCEIYLIKITCHRIIIISLLVAANDAVNKCYHGLTIMFNLKTLRLIVDLGMLKVSLAFAKSICRLSVKKFLNLWHLIPMTAFLFSLYNVNPQHFPRNIEAASIT